MTEYRVEKDSLGEIEVPKEALYQAQTQRALNNFKISGRTFPQSFYRALAQIKLAAAEANESAGKLTAGQAEAIRLAARAVIAGEHSDQFKVDIFQTGSGTSTNMNMNEVLSTLASRHAGESVHANDHINCSQSSNDVIPSALQLSAANELHEKLLPAITQMLHSLTDKMHQVGGIVKTGRTHLMDALPLTLTQELECWHFQLQENHHGLKDGLEELCALPIGGTAIGTGLNCPKDFDKQVCDCLRQATGLPISPCTNKFSRIASQDVAVRLSGKLNALAITLMKIANDLRWMNSGPLSGLAEIRLEALQPGSSIMPGKVNPVIPEAVAMVCAKVMGLHQSISIAGQSGNFQLNVMLPLIADSLLESLHLLSQSQQVLSECIDSFEVNTKQLQQALEKNPILVTALNERIGYEKAARIAKLAYQQGRPIIEIALEHTELSEDELKKLLDPKKMT
ncbi:class II fumarate hydratase [Lacimicrobium alkaliphilum]|uniref:Fumarate hydratase class II n=1 Tax=Lacimicrobium alkaliphilum TaxID=1526571 RepID=A0ABQ1RBW2_9ALTE|nr:class II fumarate hydratase [Lacimicrobium alkaliphilum]GGD65237.1 fumarate hydratase class II [Lacimicrobium alkaliphilum]